MPRPATDPAKGGFHDQMHWWALGDYSTDSLLKRLGRYKIAQGTSALALAMLDDARADIALGQPVRSIRVEGEHMRVRTNGLEVRARSVVVAVPLNVLSDIDFGPGLTPERKSAHQEKHVCAGTKFLARVDRSVGAPCARAAGTSAARKTRFTARAGWSIAPVAISSAATRSCFFNSAIKPLIQSW